MNEQIPGPVDRQRDGFDISTEVSQAIVESGHQGKQVATGQDILIKVMSNPKALVSQLGLTEDQAQNVASIMAGGGAGLGYKYLSTLVGGEIAGAVGGAVGAFLAKKLLK